MQDYVQFTNKKGGIVFAHQLKTSKKGQKGSVGDIHLPRNSFTMKQKLFGRFAGKLPGISGRL